MEHPYRLVAGALLVALAGACAFDPTVPVDPDGDLPRIACDQDPDCPPDWLCNVSTGLCVPTAARDSTPPALDGTPTLDPSVG